MSTPTSWSCPSGGLVDASVVALAKRLRITTVATLNHRDFTVVRPAHYEALTLIP